MRKTGCQCVTIALSSIVLFTAARAGTVDVRVVDARGEPVQGVVAFVDGVTDGTDPGAAGPAIMDQLDKEFVPHVLVVRKGTPVRFPNSDPVAHHVYSFSRPNDFVLPLYKGNPHEPMAFKYDGVVTLGCNIHDNMVGYIVVVDSTAFGLTDESGRVTLATGADIDGRNVRIWSPRIRDDETTLLLPVGAGAGAELVFELKKRLRPAHGETSSSVEWSDY